MPEITAEEYFKGKDDQYVKDIFIFVLNAPERNNDNR